MFTLPKFNILNSKKSKNKTSDFNKNILKRNVLYCEKLKTKHPQRS